MESSPPASKNSRIRPYLTASLLYLIVAILFTYPLFLHPVKTFIDAPGGGSNDQFLGIWNAWWVIKAFFELGSSPLSTHYLYFPEGADLGLHELTIVNNLLTIPAQILLPRPYGLVLGFNIGIILSFVVAGIGAFALFEYLTRNPYAAFVGGLAFALMPYRSLHIIHIALLSTGWMPLYLLFLLKSIKQPRPLNAFLAGLFVLLTLYSCMSYVYFLILATVPILLYYALFERKQLFSKPALIGLALVGLLSAIVMLPQTLVALRTSGASGELYDTAEMFSANAAGYLIPSWKHVLYRPITNLLPIDFFTGVPGDATFLGYVLIALSVIGVWKTRHDKWGPWAFVAGFFFVISLGPTFHFMGKVWSFSLPYAFLHDHLPFFNVMRAPYRFALFVTLALAAFAAYGLDAIMTTPEKNQEASASLWNFPKRHPKLVAVIAALLVTLEMWNVPFKAREVVVPEIYYEIAKEEGDFGILDLPRTYRKVAAYMLYQTVHEKPIAAGLISRRTEEQDRIGAELSSPRFSTPGGLTQDDVARLREKGFRYIIYHSTRNGEDIVISVIGI